MEEKKFKNFRGGRNFLKNLAIGEKKSKILEVEGIFFLNFGDSKILEEGVFFLIWRLEEKNSKTLGGRNFLKNLAIGGKKIKNFRGGRNFFEKFSDWRNKIQKFLRWEDFFFQIWRKKDFYINCR